MDETIYSPSLMASLLSSGTQSLPTAQPVQAVPYYDEALIRPRDLLADETMMSPRDIAAVPVANAGVVSPFTTNPYMVVDYGKETNVPSFENTQNLDPTKTYTLTNPATGQVMAQSDPNDPTSLARLVQQANVLSGNAATDANWEISQDGNLVASDYPNQLGGVLGALVQYGLPLGLSLIPGVGWAGSAALAGAGSTAGKLISNYSLEDALKSGLITAGTAGLLKAPILEGGGSLSGALSNALGFGNAPTSAFDRAFDADYASWLASGADVAAPAFSGAVGGAGGTLGGSVAGTDAGGNFIQVLGSGAGSRIPASVLSGALSAAAAAPGLINYGNQVWGDQVTNPSDTNEIVVEGRPILDENGIPIGYGPTITAEGAPQAKQETPPADNNEIVVTGQYKPPTYNDMLAGVVGAVAPTLINPNITQPTQATDSKKSTLEDILKYYTLGSGLLDMLGVGQGGAASGTASPYASTLGAVPNFGRGTFQPFTGDYEQYAFGPEWNFFGNNAQTPATTANTLTATTPANTLLPAPTAITATPTAGTATTGVTAGLLNAPMQATKQQAAQYISNLTAGNVAKAPEVTVPGLTGAQQLYLNSLSGTSNPTASNIDYVRSLSDYQALASLANTQGVFQPLNSPLSGYKTASDLSALYGVPVTSM